MDVVITALLAVIVIMMIVGTVILNGIAKKFGIAVDKLIDELRPTVKSIHENVEKLRPAIEVIGQKKGEIEKVLSELPETVSNYKEISESILPVTRAIGERTPEITQALEVLSKTTSRLKEKAEELNEKMKPTFSTLSGLAQAFYEGIRVFKAIRK